MNNGAARVGSAHLNYGKQVKSQRGTHVYNSTRNRYGISKEIPEICPTLIRFKIPFNIF